MEKIIFDSNIFDLLVEDSDAVCKLNDIIKLGIAEILIPSTICDELKKSPFKGVPALFPYIKITDAVFILGQSRLGEARLGDGRVYQQHKGDSQQLKDAIIADTANLEATMFVSQDNRNRSRLRNLSKSCKSLTFDEFLDWLKNIEVEEH